MNRRIFIIVVVLVVVALSLKKTYELYSTPTTHHYSTFHLLFMKNKEVQILLLFTTMVKVANKFYKKGISNKDLIKITKQHNQSNIYHVNVNNFLVFITYLLLILMSSDETHEQI